MSSRSSVKSPTSVDDVPTFVLLPAGLARTWSRSGNVLPVTVLVQKVTCWPFWIVWTGVSSQLLIVAVSAPLLKLAAMYDVGSPECDGKTASLPWNQSVTPSGWLWLIMNQSGRFVMSSNPSTVQPPPPERVRRSTLESDVV